MSFFADRRTRSPRRLTLETLESRWTPSWAGIPPASITPPARAASVTLDTLRSASGNAAIQNTEVDYYKFTTTVGGRYRIATASGQIDTVLGLFNAKGARVAFNDDISIDNQDSEIAVSLNPRTQYYLGVTNYRGSQSGTYHWLIDGPSNIDDTREDNDTFATARNVGVFSGLRTIGQLVMNDGHDWFKFTTRNTGETNHYVQLDFLHAQGNLELELYDSRGTRIGSSTTAKNVERISLNNLDAGTYYVHGYGYNGVNNPSYRLTIVAPDAPPSGIDLRGAVLRATNTAPWGTAITIQSAVENRGSQAAGPFQTQWWLSQDSTWSSDDIILTELNGNPARTINRLNAGDTSSTINVTLALPPAGYVDWKGNRFYIVQRTDSGNTVREIDETNNSGQVGVGRDFDPIIVGVGTRDFQIDLAITGLTASQRRIFEQAANRWEQVIIGDLPDANYNGRAVDDLLITARGVSIDGRGGVLGRANPDRFRSGSSIPYHGVMEFDTADLASLEANGTLFNVILHEMGHVLGIGTLWSRLGLIQGSGGSNPRFTGSRALAQYNAIFGTNANGVPVENSGNTGTRDFHWRESILNTELLTGSIEAAGVPMPLSRVTVASLADLGYRVNLSAADSFQPRRANPASSGNAATSARGIDAVMANLESLLQIDSEQERKKRMSIK